MDPLFREEVLKANRVDVFGEVIISSPVSVRYAVFFALLATTFILCLLIFCSYTKRVHVTGALFSQERPVRVFAPAAGVVKLRIAGDEKLVSEGDEVVELLAPQQVGKLRTLGAGMQDERVVLVATKTGIAESFDIEDGQMVSSGQYLFTIFPNGGKLEVKLHVPLDVIDVVQVGTPLALRYRMFPYQKHGHAQGIITRIATSAVPAAALQNDSGRIRRSGDLMCTITLSISSQTMSVRGQSRALHAGMAVDAEIPVERRKLYQWVLTPLYEFAGA